MALYLMGIFMGAIDTGIITPARTVIQSQLGVDEQTGIWMITIYTLAYAAAIPVMGKLADRNGRKPVYLASIALFGIGSLLCGLSQDVGSFEMLIAARALQAVGGGGILPIATADIGTAVPPEKRGMALGLVGAVYGIANVFGASAGSLVLDVVGIQNWQWIFYINLPISLAILALGVRYLPNRRADSVPPIDVAGCLVVVAMILSLLWGIRNLDFFDFAASLASTEVWPWLVGFLALIPVLVLVERRAADPVLNLGYFTDRGIALTLMLSMLSGVILMGVVFVPQFAENALNLPTGSGGYLVIVLGLASGIGAPLSGRLTDRFGPRLVLGLGCLVSLVAAATIILWAIPQPSMTSVLVSLALIGLGLGFVIGSPLNYMMLERVPDAAASSALGTLSLVRSIGTTLAPALMVGFLANAGADLQDRITDELPSTVTAPALPHAAELKATLGAWKADPDMAERVPDIDLSYLDQTTIDLDSMSGSGELPPDLVELLKTADITTIVPRAKTVAARMFDQETPTRVAEIQSGIQSGIDGLGTGLAEVEKADADMTSGLAEMDTNLNDMQAGMAEMDAQLPEMRSGLKEMDAKLAEMASGRAKMDAQLTEMNSGLATMDGQLAKMDDGLAGMAEGLAGIDEGIAGMRKAISGLDQAIAGMDRGLAEQRAALVAASRPRPSTPPSAAPTPGATASTQPTGAPSTATPTPTPEQPSASAPPVAAVPPAQLQAQLAALKDAIAQTEKERAEAVAQRDGLRTKLADATKERATLAAERGKLQAGRNELAKARGELATGRAELTKARDGLVKGQTELTKARGELATGLTKVTQARKELGTGHASLTQARRDLAAGQAELRKKRDEIVTTRQQLGEMKDAVPATFAQALASYEAEIDARAPRIERAFQSGLNSGFEGLYTLFAGACALALVLLLAVGSPNGRPVAR